MLRNFSAAALALVACAAVSFAQTQAGASAQHSTSAASRGGQLDLASGTRLTGELQNTLDVSRARVGDRVVLKTTEAVKQNGRTVVKKGAQLVGRVADVQRRAGRGAGSSMTVVFDTLQSGSLSAPVALTIDSVTRASARARAGDEELGAEAGASSRTSASTSSSGGGLLGGVTGAVGNTVGGVTSAAGGAVGATTETVGGVARGAGDTLGRIQVTQAAGLSAEGGSTLSLAAGDLRLEKGTTFRLTVRESARVGNNQ